jgi:hypothetical protein
MQLHRTFLDYVRGVFAEHSERAEALRARRAAWLRRLGKKQKFGVRAPHLLTRG